MPSFDVVSEIDWQEVDNAVNQALKEVSQRFDFKKVECKIDVKAKEKQLVLSTSQDDKIDAFVEVFKLKLAKRSLPVMAFEFQATEPAASGGARKRVNVQAGIDKDKAKKIVKIIKEQRFKAQAQIQDEQVRVSAKKRDDLQEIIAYLKEQQSKLSLPMQFANFRD